MPEKLYKPPYAFSTTIGETCTRKMVTFLDLAEKLKMDVTDLMAPVQWPTLHHRRLWSKAAKELDIDEGLLERLAADVRKDFAAPGTKP